jgi:BirA family transcriptional regulator, biotin operon repressor / biotin---[acetyl-CoA-carboxylase] ligase
MEIAHTPTVLGVSNEVLRTPLDEAEINSKIAPYWRVSVVELTGSTQNDLLQLIESKNALDGQVIVTEYQSNGRGRLDRTFEAPTMSALLFSFYIKPRRQRSEWGFIPLIAGLSLARTISTLDSAINVSLKWPNDCIIDEKKCAGMIAQTTDEGIVIGIGLNVSMTSNELPVPSATSLAIEGSTITDRNLLLSHILNTFAELFEAWEEGSELLNEYANVSSTIGKKVRIELPSGENLEATVARISHTGELVLDDGRHVSAGDVIHLR